MSEPKLISPLLDQFVMGPSFSDHHGVCCCPAMTKDANKRYIVKIISIPASQVQLDALLLAGAYSSKDAALSYFKELAADIAAETEVLKKLSRFEGFLPYEDLQIVEMDDGRIGYQVYLLSPYKRTLERHMRNNNMTQLNAVNLGLDLCASMVMCRRAGYLYVDLKPGNIFINDKNEYCVGDLGFIRLDSLKYASLPDKYRSPYTAPELTDAFASLNETVDTYAIGMLLYQIYNDGRLPEGETIPAPVYADYEMAEIIMKAIAADPDQRWKDPMEMGQALVAYMQRNSVNDVPIVPLPEPEPAPEPAEPEAPAEAPAEEVAEAEAEEEIPSDEVPQEETDTASQPEEVPEQPEEVQESDTAVSDEATDLSFMDEMPQDDTTPAEETVGAVAYEELSDDTSDILAQADELLAMEMPEPVVAPEPIEIPMPEPIVLEDEAPAEEEPVMAAAAESDDAENAETEEPSQEASEEAEAEAAEPEPVAVVAEPEIPEEDIPEDEPEEPKKKRKIAGIIALILALALLLGGAAYGYHYYRTEYLQYVTEMEITGDKDQMTVSLTTAIEDSLLHVVCSDSYGNTIPGTVKDGVAVFTGLNPDTIYKVSVSMDGFHELRGELTGTYTTPAQTKIVSFEATAGNEPGSVILTFTVEGKDTNNWTISYSTEGENEKSETFSGHILTVNNLTPGKEYTFRLTSADELYMVGTQEITFKVAPLIFAENLSITQHNTDGLTAVWTAPAGAEGIVWSVRCYNDAGFEQVLETTELTVTFTEVDPSQGYTVEVIAQGMSAGTMTHISARSATITGFKADTSKPLTVTVTWTFEGDAPQGGWLVTYGVKNGDTTTVLVTEPALSIYPAMPDDQYTIKVTAADGITVLDNTFTCTAGDVQVFSGYGVTADNLSFSMCKTPKKENWTWKDLSNSSYTNNFKIGEKISFLVKLNGNYKKSDDYVDILFVIRNKNKEIICTSSTGASWTYLWDNKYCELDIPTVPTKAGDYYIDVYFNGMAAARDFFTIK